MEQNPIGQGEQQPPFQQAAVQPPQKSSRNTIVIIIVAVVVLGVAALVGGYFLIKTLRENMMEKDIEQMTDQKADVSVEGGNLVMESDEGTYATSEEGTIKLPSDFPSDVFVYSDAKINYAVSMPANEVDGIKAAFRIAYNVNQNVADVVVNYKAEMAKNGWIEETEAKYEPDDGEIMVRFKKGMRETLVTISSSQGKQSGVTEVSILVSEN